MALQRHSLGFVAKMEDEFDVTESMQQTGVDDVHDVGKIQRAVGAFGPAAISAKEFSSSCMSQQSFHRLFKIHGSKLPAFGENPNGVYPVKIRPSTTAGVRSFKAEE